MRNELLQKADKNVACFFTLLDKITKGLEGIGANNRQLLNGELYLTDRELSQRLKISRRTLQEYRSAGKIPYYMVCGKVLYKESEIERILQENYKKIVDENDLI